MSIFEDINDTTNKASNIGERYIKASHQYFRLKIFQQLTLSLSLIAKIVAVTGFLFAGLVFMSIAASIELGKAVESYSLGFLLVGLIYLVISIIIFMLRSKLNTYIIKKVGLKFFS